MKFQKTLLAAALAVVGFGVQAATTTEPAANNIATAVIAKYTVGSDSYYYVEAVDKQGAYLQAGQWYKTNDPSTPLTLSKEAPVGVNLDAYEARGQVTFKTDSLSNTVEEETGAPEFQSNTDKNYYWSHGGTTTTTVTTTEGGTLDLSGLLVNAGENGNTNDYNEKQDIKVIFDPITTEKVETNSTKKDVQIGNLTEVATGTNSEGLAVYDFDLVQNKAQGTLATLTSEETKGNTSVTALTGAGLAVLDAPKGSLVDLEKGTVTTVVENLGDGREDVKIDSYTVDGKSVYKIDNEYYSVDTANKVLTKYEGDKQALEARPIPDASGLADELIGGETVTSVNTGLVSNKNVTYGESVTTQTVNNGLAISITDPNNADAESGEIYTIGAATNKVSTISKNVVTGIITEDPSGKTYGLKASESVDGKETKYTEVTAEGIVTTGDVTIFKGSDKETTVGKFVESATSAVDAKVDAALQDVDSRLQQFNGQAARLNSRIDDVEKTSYRGIAIALAAQQQIPNIAAGQFAVFGGVGHYEGETAGALGVASVFADGRTSVSAALGVAGSNEVGGRVGVAYVFGGK